jgi:hypothetical protein
MRGVWFVAGMLAFARADADPKQPPTTQQTTMPRWPSSSAPTQEAMVARQWADSVRSTYPFARDLMLLAATLLEQQLTTASAVRPEVDSTVFAGCGALDRKKPLPVLKVGRTTVTTYSCTVSCMSVGIDYERAIFHDGILASQIKGTLGVTAMAACPNERTALSSELRLINSGKQLMDSAVQARLAMDLGSSKNASNAVERFEGLARYILLGGDASFARAEIATLLKRQASWRGFIWIR